MKNTAPTVLFLQISRQGKTNSLEREKSAVDKQSLRLGQKKGGEVTCWFPHFLLL